MPFWRFNPNDRQYKAAIGETVAERQRLPRRRRLNGLDRNEYELARAGIDLLNGVSLPRSGNERLGGFERQTLSVYSEGGFRQVEVVTFDSGVQSRELVRTTDLSAETYAAVQQSETLVSSQELSQSFDSVYEPEALAPDVVYDVGDPVDQPFYYQGPTQIYDPGTGTSSSSGGSVGSTSTTTTSGGGGGGTQVLPPPPPPPPPPPDTYDPYFNYPDFEDYYG